MSRPTSWYSSRPLGRRWSQDLPEGRGTIPSRSFREGRPRRSRSLGRPQRAVGRGSPIRFCKSRRLEDLAAGTTINVGVIKGGTTSNVVPAAASAEIDVRVASKAEEARIESALHSLGPITPDTRLTMSGGINRPPMERTPAIALLLGQAQLIGKEIGIDLTEGSTGGGSDGNFTAALGIPTLDGLGARGAGAHADTEHVVIDSLAERAALLAALLLKLQMD